MHCFKTRSAIAAFTGRCLGFGSLGLRAGCLLVLMVAAGCHRRVAAGVAVAAACTFAELAGLLKSKS